MSVAIFWRVPNHMEKTTLKIPQNKKRYDRHLTSALFCLVLLVLLIFISRLACIGVTEIRAEKNRRRRRQQRQPRRSKAGGEKVAAEELTAMESPVMDTMEDKSIT